MSTVRRRMGAGLALVLWLCAAAAPAPSPAPLRVGTTLDYRPFSFLDEATPRGLDISLAERVAGALGRPLVLVPVRWPDLLRVAGTVDVLMSGVTIRADRLPVLAFSRPYALTGAVVVIRAGDRRRLPTLAEIDRPDVRLAVNAGGHLERVARERFGRARIEPVADNTALATRLRRGLVDAVVSDSAEARAWGAHGFAVLGPFTRDRKAWAVPLERADLVATLDAWLAAREEEGVLDALRRTWLGPEASRDADEMCLEAVTAAVSSRLQLMPYVAAVKRRDRLPVVDLRQERRVLRLTASAALQAGLHPGRVRGLVRRLIRLGRAIQQHGPRVEPGDGLELDRLRAGVRTAGLQLVAELGRCRRALQADEAPLRLRAALAPAGAALGLGEAGLGELAAAACRAVRP